MTDREIMQQALYVFDLFYESGFDREDCFAVIKALRERLAQPEHKPMHPTLQKMWEGYFDKCYKREWIGLTDEEIDKIFETKVWDARRSFARAIEAKLKERNT